LLAAGKEKEITAAIVGFGTTSHVLSAMLRKAGLKHRVIPFGSGSKAVKALLGGNADFGMPGAVSGQSHANDGRIRVLAVTADKPVVSYPGIPTAKQLGYPIELNMYRGLMGPPGMDENISKKLADAMEKAVNDPEFQAAAKKSGYPIVPMNTAEWKRVIQKSFEDLKKIAPDMKADMAKRK
jgi:tripartite-type tricarboxylate transporter receptor subunit TctC